MVLVSFEWNVLNLSSKHVRDNDRELFNRWNGSKGLRLKYSLTLPGGNLVNTNSDLSVLYKPIRGGLLYEEAFYGTKNK